MSPVSDSTAGNTFYAQLVGTRDRLAALEDPFDPAEFQTFERVREVIGRLVNLIDDADPMLVSPNLLNLMGTNIGPLAAAVEQYAETADSTQLANAVGQLDALIAVVGWPLAYSFKKAVGLRQFAHQYRAAVDGYLSAIDAQVNELAEQAGEIAGQITQANASLASTAADGIAKLTTGTEQATAQVEATAAAAESRVDEAVADADARLETLVAAVETNKIRLDTLTTGYNASFLEEQTARATRADQSLNEEQAKHELIRTQAQAALADSMTGWAGSAQATLASLADLEQQAREVVGVTSTVAITTGYRQYADQERGTANLWRRLAVGFLVAAVAWSAFFVWLTANTKFDWSELVLKVFVSVPLFALAAYAVEQSGRHRVSERNARESELQLAAIDPYLARLEPADRNRIKFMVAEKMFAATPAIDAKVPDVDLDKVLAIIKAIRG